MDWHVLEKCGKPGFLFILDGIEQLERTFVILEECIDPLLPIDDFKVFIADARNSLLYMM